MSVCIYHTRLFLSILINIRGFPVKQALCYIQHTYIVLHTTYIEQAGLGRSPICTWITIMFIYHGLRSKSPLYLCHIASCTHSRLYHVGMGTYIRWWSCQKWPIDSMPVTEWYKVNISGHLGKRPYVQGGNSVHATAHFKVPTHFLHRRAQWWQSQYTTNNLQ